MTRDQRARIKQTAVEIAARLGRAAGDIAVGDDGCPGVEIIRHRDSHFGLGDVEPVFVLRLWRSIERVGGSERDLDEIREECWIAWVRERNSRVLELCPRAREYDE